MKRLLWKYPTPEHPRWQRLWQVAHWRRHRRFRRDFDALIGDYWKRNEEAIRAEAERRMWSDRG